MESVKIIYNSHGRMVYIMMPQTGAMNQPDLNYLVITYKRCLMSLFSVTLKQCYSNLYIIAMIQVVGRSSKPNYCGPMME